MYNSEIQDLVTKRESITSELNSLLDSSYKNYSEYNEKNGLLIICGNHKNEIIRFLSICNNFKNVIFHKSECCLCVEKDKSILKIPFIYQL